MEQAVRKTFSKEEIFLALDGILETGPLNLCGVMLAMPIELNITREMAWELFEEWAESALRRYRKIVDSDGNVVFELTGAGTAARGG